MTLLDPRTGRVVTVTVPRPDVTETRQVQLDRQAERMIRALQSARDIED